MASPAVAAPALTAATHQASQAMLMGELANPLQVAWASFDPTDPNTLQRLILAIQAIVQHFGKASGSAAASFYEHERRQAGVPGHFNVQIAPVSLDKVDASIRWATKDLWSPEPDLAAIQSKVRGVTEKNVLDIQRDTTIGAVHADRQCKGWYRQPEPGACSFCALLATRGEVYKETSFDKVNAKFKVNDKSGDFKAHDFCRCTAHAIFNAYEPSAQIREWQALYAEVTKGIHGPKAMRAAFRNAFPS